MNESTSSLIPIRAGFVALTDCAPIVAACELGLGRDLGIEIEPVRLPTWSAIRDHMAFEKLECAHMLCGLPIAMHLGLGGLQTDMMVPLMLGSGGNAITISEALHREMGLEGKTVSRVDTASYLRQVVRRRKERGLNPLRFAMVHPFSSHNYELRSWLAHGGVNPNRDVEIQVVPPVRMVEALRSGSIDGYCVGEPWNQIAVEEGLGRIVVTKADLYPGAPEKVVALRRGWVAGHTDVAAAVVKTIARAMTWASAPSNLEALSVMLAKPEYLNMDANIILRSLECKPIMYPGGKPKHIANYLSFDGKGTAYPHISKALWVLAQMRRWEQVIEGLEEQASFVYDPTIIERSPEFSGQERFKVRGMETYSTFDGAPFTPDDVEGYQRSFPVRGGFTA